MVFGAGVTGQAVASVLSGEGLDVVVVDDVVGVELSLPTGEQRTTVDSAGGAYATRANAAGDVEVISSTSSSASIDSASPGVVRVVRAPSAEQLRHLIGRASQVVVSPGVPPSHLVHKLAGDKLISEITLARSRLKVPLVAITGTNGKTTVVTLVTRMLTESGMHVQAAGNIGTPLISVDSSLLDVVVAELSSFQLATTSNLAPDVGAWLNFQPDHLDWHKDIDDYRLSKARMWEGIGAESVVVANACDKVVMEEARRVESTGACLVTWGGTHGMWHRKGDMLMSPDGEELLSAHSLYRSMPHDIDNALAAMAIATSAGASIEGCVKGLLQFRGLPHRVELIADYNGVKYIDDSKSTTPSSTAVAIAGIGEIYGQGRIVLIAGGRSKGLDLGILRDYSDFLKSVVAIGESSREVESAISDMCPVTLASSMRDAVVVATRLAGNSGVVLLSPACSSYDWYESYVQRGDDFRRCVEEMIRNGGTL